MLPQLWMTGVAAQDENVKKQPQLRNSTWTRQRAIRARDDSHRTYVPYTGSSVSLVPNMSARSCTQHLLFFRTPPFRRHCQLNCAGAES